MAEIAAWRCKVGRLVSASSRRSAIYIAVGQVAARNGWILARLLCDFHAWIAAVTTARDFMDAIRLREATQADAVTLGSLHVASWHETYTGILPDEMLAGLTVETRTAMWSKILVDPDASGGTAVFVAEDRDRIENLQHLIFKCPIWVESGRWVRLRHVSIGN